MITTLDALNQAVIENPADRTVRLVYADALDETGDPIAAARAEFIRAQVELEPLASTDPRRLVPYSRAFDLFDAHWLDWWYPVTETAGLPPPHVPGRRLRDVFTRATRRRRRRRVKNWPYTHSTGDTTVHLTDFGIAVRFVAGFPEEVTFGECEDAAGSAELVYQWGDAMPLRRLAFTRAVGEEEWDRIHGPHLSRLPELELAHPAEGAVTSLTQSSHLTALRELSLGSVTGDLVPAIVARPPWEHLRVLRLTGHLVPASVRDVATFCTLTHLEELDLVVGNAGGLGNVLFEAFNQLMQHFSFGSMIPPRVDVRWADYGPSLEALAAAPWVRRLRRLRITTGGLTGLLGSLGTRLYGQTESAADLLPDAAVFRLADALDPDKLDTLVLPAAVVGPSARETLTTRLGPRVAFL